MFSNTTIKTDNHFIDNNNNRENIFNDSSNNNSNNGSVSNRNSNSSNNYFINRSKKRKKNFVSKSKDFKFTWVKFSVDCSFSCIWSLSTFNVKTWFFGKADLFISSNFIFTTFIRAVAVDVWIFVCGIETFSAITNFCSFWVENILISETWSTM